ncbi:MAG TPA: porin [Thermoanaerobaculia bacterium]|nr:porin [Thermoanaerobaculia bacterium]
MAQGMAQESPVVVGWKDGKTTIETERASLTLSNRIQFRFTHEDPDSGNGKDSFRIRRAKTKLDGWLYKKNLTWELQLNWADTSSSLEDANINYAFSRALQIKGGQFKVPFGRQELTSSGSQQFVDRSIVSSEFAKGRDAGVQIWGLSRDNRFEWRAGAFNGNGRNASSNDNGALQYDARVTFQPWGDVKYSESDFESSGRPLLAVAVQYEHNDRHGATAGNDVSRAIAGGDVAFKYRGISAFGEFFHRDNHPESGPDSASDGWNVQAGIFVVPRTIEVAARYATWDPSDRAAHDRRTESGIALNWFINKHNLKLQSDLRRIEHQAAGTSDLEARMQLQFIF